MLYGAGNSKPILCDNLEGWDGWEGGFKRKGHNIYLWLVHVDIRQNPTQYYKAIILQLKMISKKK